MMKKKGIRIQSGSLCGRYISIDKNPALRPSTSIVRETLMNWLRYEIYDLNCLDLFAGSGVLGVEAISNGAGSCTFVENKLSTIKRLEGSLAELCIKDKAKILRKDFRKAIADLDGKRFELIFLDPPYAKDLLPYCLEKIKAFSPKFIYIEDEKDIDISIKNISGYRIIKKSRSGQVFFALLNYEEKK